MDTERLVKGINLVYDTDLIGNPFDEANSNPLAGHPYFTETGYIESDISNGMVSDIEALNNVYDRKPRPSKKAFFDKKIKEGVWIQRDGTEIRIKDMKDSHIRNCINMLKRKQDYDPADKDSIANKYIRRFEKELNKRELER